MRRLNFLLMITIILIAGGVLLAGSSANCSISSLAFEGSGSISASFTGSESTLQLDWSNPDTPYGNRRDVFIATGNYSGTQTANALTVDREVTVDEGSTQFVQSYSGEEDYTGSFGSFLSCDQFGILGSSGFSSEVFAYSNYLLGHVVGLPPDLISGFYLYNLAEDGSGYSQMSANLSENCVDSPQLNIIDWTDEGLENDSVSVSAELRSGGYRIDMEAVFRSTTPVYYIEAFIKTLMGR